MALTDALSAAQQYEPQLFHDLLELLRIPSVSTVLAAQSEVQRAADWVNTYLQEIGLEHVQTLETDRNPIVYADWLHAPGQPTVLCYGHYDVQPADPLELWRTPPFEPTIDGDNVYARGAADDKGQFIIHLAAIRAILQADGRLPVNVKFLIEGEEEIGSPSLDAVLDTYHDLFQADACLISDSHMLAPDCPVIITSVRGLVAVHVEVTGPGRDLHSGTFGGAVHNPLQALCTILARLHDADGRVAVPHFYDRVRPLTEHDRAALAQIPFTRAAWLADAGNPPDDWGEPEYTISERTSSRPTLEINGLAGGFAGDGLKTVLPSRAIAKISCRLVADQDTEEIRSLLSATIHALAPPTVRVEIKPIQSGPGATVNLDHPAIQIASAAYAAVYGVAPLFVREGGSIPIVALLQNKFNMPSLLMGFGLPDDGLHSPNEKMSLAQIRRGVATIVHFFYGMAR
ncbi:MAG: dipeptidase [Anaerolineae bacterium]